MRHSISIGWGHPPFQEKLQVPIRRANFVDRAIQLLKDGGQSQSFRLGSMSNAKAKQFRSVATEDLLFLAVRDIHLLDERHKKLRINPGVVGAKH